MGKYGKDVTHILDDEIIPGFEKLTILDKWLDFYRLLVPSQPVMGMKINLLDSIFHHIWIFLYGCLNKNT